MLSAGQEQPAFGLSTQYSRAWLPRECSAEQCGHPHNTTQLLQGCAAQQAIGVLDTIHSLALPLREQDVGVLGVFAQGIMITQECFAVQYSGDVGTKAHHDGCTLQRLPML